MLLNIGNGSEYGVFIILVAALNCLLYKYTGNEDIIVGSPVFKQDVRREYFNHDLILRNALYGDMTFKELLLRVRNTLISIILD